MIVNEGLLALLRYLLRTADVDLEIRLFVNDFTPDADTELGDLSEAIFSGYAPKQTRDITWDDPTINGDEQGETLGPTVTFTADSGIAFPQDVYGLFITMKDETATTKLLFAHRFGTMITVTNDGDNVVKKLNWFDANLVP